MDDLVGLLLPKGGRQLHQGWERFLEGGTSLRVTPVIDHRHLLNARNRATWRTGLRSVVLMLEVLSSVLLQRYTRITTLLRTVVDQSLLANVKVAASGPA